VPRGLARGRLLSAPALTIGFNWLGVHLGIRPVAIAVSHRQLWIAGSGRLLHFRLTHN
jgi:hypothetical protein